MTGQQEPADPQTMKHQASEEKEQEVDYEQAERREAEEEQQAED